MSLTPQAIRCYAERNKNLKKLGFATYADYLTSALWAQIREFVLDRDKHWCKCCNFCRATQVHHCSYTLTALMGRRLTKLHAVCDSCHRAGEFSQSMKLSAREATIKMGLVKPRSHRKRRYRARRRAARKQQDKPRPVILRSDKA